ncbi:translocation protein Sec72p [[Candida] anglica]|uniref:Translocation protein Sec72p n=1 Tax=[Candida] anglica TaxID=148631 RepID=A0ABP0EBY6_9ASCO
MNVQLGYDPKSKRLALGPESVQAVPALKLEIDQLNVLTAELIANGADVPPVPTPENFNKDMSKMIRKLYEGGVQAFKQGKYEESAKQFSIGIEMISRRHKFESFQGTLQELSLFLMSRADAYLKTKNYLGAFNDADMLLGMMLCTPENFLRRGVANFFLGNYTDARADYQRGLAFDETNERLIQELEICLDKILEENGDYL